MTHAIAADSRSTDGGGGTGKFSRLLIRPGGIGDCLTTFPAMEQMRAPYTEIWTNRACIPLIDFADRTRCALARGILLLRFPEYRAQVDLADELQRFDEVVSWYGQGVPGVLEGFAALHPNVRLMPSIPPHEGREHAVDFHLRNAGVILSQKRTLHFRRWKWTGESEFIAFQAFASAGHKEWPFERFLQLEGLLSSCLPVRWFVNPSERPIPVRPAGALVCTSLDKVASDLTRAALYIGNDTGLSHLAGAIGVPSVVLFGSGSPDVWAPQSRNPVRVLRSQTGRMDSIEVKEVERAASELLDAAILRAGSEHSGQ